MLKPKWIVNDLGELGVEILGRCFFLYKGENIEYEDGLHDDGSPMLYRPVGKREFGETCKPDIYWTKGYSCEGRYTEELVHIPGLSYYLPEYGRWRPLPRTTTTTTTLTTTTTTLQYGATYWRQYKRTLRWIIYKYLTRLIDYLFLK